MMLKVHGENSHERIFQEEKFGTFCAEKNASLEASLQS